MKRILIGWTALVATIGAFADARVDGSLDQFARFFRSGTETIASISLGVSGTNLVPSMDGTIEKILTPGDYEGFYQGGVVIRCAPSYFYQGATLQDEYFVLISNITVNPSLSVGAAVRGWSTSVGATTGQELPFGGGHDSKVVVFTYEKYNPHLVALSEGFPGIELPGVEGTYLFPAKWIFAQGAIDYLAFRPLKGPSDLKDTVHELTGQSATFNLDLAHTVAVKLDVFSTFPKTADNPVLARSIAGFRSANPGFFQRPLEEYQELKIDGVTVYVLASSSMMGFYQKEVSAEPPVLYLRTLGSFQDGSEMKALLYLVDFQPYFFEDRVRFVVDAAERKAKASGAPQP